MTVLKHSPLLCATALSALLVPAVAMAQPARDMDCRKLTHCHSGVESVFDPSCKTVDDSSISIRWAGGEVPIFYSSPETIFTPKVSRNNDVLTFVANGAGTSQPKKSVQILTLAPSGAATFSSSYISEGELIWLWEEMTCTEVVK